MRRGFWRQYFGVILVTLLTATANGQAAPEQSEPQASVANDPPNVLILLADDFMYANLGLENPLIETPNLDRLASQGVRFTRYAVNHPQCSPSRATLMTGLYSPIHQAWTNNLYLNPPNTTYLAEVFQHAGYGTGYSGKWHLDGGGNPATGEVTFFFRLTEESYVWPSRRRGFQDWLGYECCPFHNAPFYWDDSVKPPAYTPVPEFGWETRFQRAALRDFVQRKKAANQPWMYQVAVAPPHTPNIAPPEFMSLYDPDTIPLPEWITSDLTPEQELVARRTLQAVYAMVSFADYEIGNMLADLDELGEADNTIIIFLADNGDLLGSHWDRFGFTDLEFRGKDFPYQNAFHCPLIMRWPGRIPAGLELDTLISTIDLPPTILSLADLPVPWRMQGTDMSAWARGGQGPVHPGVWLHLQKLFAPIWFAVWDGDYIYSEGDVRHLYDVNADPNETTNLFDDPAVADVKAELSSLLASLTAEAFNPRTLPDLCADREKIERQLDETLQRPNREFRVDGISVRAYIELMLAVACGESDNVEVRTALLSAFGHNMDAFDRSDFHKCRRFRELLALIMSGNGALENFIKTTLSNRNIPVQGEYQHVTCVDAGTCFPESPFQSGEDSARGTTEPLSGSGDLDGDGLTNATEFQNAHTAGTGVDGFVRAALDATRDGTETGTGGGGGGGGCFIATAAYGTPLAVELDQFRAIRDDALLTNAAGAAFTNNYYRLSPNAAEWLAAHPFTKASVRVVLGLFLEAYSYSIVLIALGFCIIFAAAYRVSRRNPSRFPSR